MFCPRCATQNIDGASFCRSCGADISLIPQALEGHLATTEHPQRFERYARRKRNREPNIGEAVQNITMGIAFVIISILVAEYAPAGAVWWFWMLIPAFGCFGKGFAELARLRVAKSGSNSNAQRQLNTVRQANLAASKTGDLMNPAPSVTEGTTRHLGADQKTRPFEYSDSEKPS
jgi:hypothetical protein